MLLRETRVSTVRASPCLSWCLLALLHVARAPRALPQDSPMNRGYDRTHQGRLAAGITAPSRALRACGGGECMRTRARGSCPGSRAEHSRLTTVSLTRVGRSTPILVDPGPRPDFRTEIGRASWRA